MILSTRPIVSWPGAETRIPSRSDFKASYRDTLILLDRELSMLRARHPVVQLWVKEGDIRADGELRGDRRPMKPGVILIFDSRHGQLRYACDRFDGWHHNLRAIALALEALRKVERYGVGSGAEQYAGWRALPAGLAVGSSITTTEDAAAFIVEHAGVEWYGDDKPGTIEALIGDTSSQLPDAYRFAAKKLHPDQGGDPDLFKQLGDCRRILEASL